MKLLISIFAVITGTMTYAAEAPVKSCHATIRPPIVQSDGKIDVDIYKGDNGYYAITSTAMEGNQQSIRDNVTVTDLATVREITLIKSKDAQGRDTYETSPANEDLTPTEGLIAHAMLYTSDPDLGKTVVLGFDLKDVKSAKVYRVGEETNMGSSSIIEAYGADGKVLGSFLGGFLVAPCE